MPDAEKVRCWWRRLWHRMTCNGWEKGDGEGIRLCSHAAHLDGTMEP